MTVKALSPILSALLWANVAVVFVAVNALFLVWMERKVSARIQLRRGPLVNGPFGLLQTLADALKLISKELILPRRAHAVLYLLAPVVVFFPVVGSFAVIPFSPHGPAGPEGGFLVMLGLSSLAFLGIFMGGWGSNNKYAALGALRAVAQNLSYEIPLLLSSMGIVLIVGSLRLTDIAAAQSGLWFAAAQPVAFLVFFISVLAETNRAPFDIPEAESELVAGFHTEYTGMRFALFFLAEYTGMFLGGALGSFLFLGGWNGPGGAHPAYLVLKIYLWVFVMMWVRWTFPRLRSDQLLSLSWKYLLPAALLNLILCAAWKTWA